MGSKQAGGQVLPDRFQVKSKLSGKKKNQLEMWKAREPSAAAQQGQGEAAQAHRWL